MIRLVQVNAFSGSSERPAQPDKNGKMPVYLSLLSGQPIPSTARVISGTVAENSGLYPGQTCAVQIQVSAVTEAGVNYSYTVLSRDVLAMPKDSIFGALLLGAQTQIGSSTPVTTTEDDGSDMVETTPTPQVEERQEQD